MQKIKLRLGKPQSGQALVEYTLIVVLVIMAFWVTLAATGPAIGNVFSNTVCNLVQQQNCATPPRGIPDVAAFWATVTWAAQQTPQESPFPTNPPIPPPATATAGPSPTPSPTIPTRTPIPSATPGPTATPTDFRFAAPDWYERANPDTAVHWRLDNSVFLGGEEWIGDYYPTNNLTGTPERRANSTLTPPSPFAIDFAWLGSSAPLPNWPGGVSSPALNGENFSVRWFRRIYVAAPVTLNFDLRSDDQARFYIVGGSRGGNINDPASGSGSGGCGAPCLVLNDWTAHSARTRSTPTDAPTVTLPAGNYLFIVEYAELTGNAEVSLNIRPRSVPVNTNDSPAPADCSWGRTNSTSSSSRTWMWEEYTGGTIPANTRCTLEFRGRVYVPPASGIGSMPAAHFQFWSVWDFSNAATTGYVEFADYASRQPDGTYPAGSWQRVNLFQGSSANYNWTRFNINLSNVNGVNFQGKELAFRFVIDSGASGSSARNWYIDDMTIQSFSPDTTNIRVGQMYNLDQDSQRGSFITTENWGLSSNYVHGSTGMAFNDSPGGALNAQNQLSSPGAAGNVNYSRFQNSDCPSGSCPNAVAAPGQSTPSRVYYIEFNGWVDLSGTLPDLEGDTGLPLLSFWHAYDIGNRGRLEVQYTRDPFISIAGANSSVRTTWTRVPGAALRDGNILPLDTSVTRSQLSFVQREVGLDSIPFYDTQRFRLRFAMIIDRDAGEEDGWWIDDIYIERMSRPRFSPYPFFDDAELGDSNWSMEGSWARFGAESVFNTGSWVYTDTPLGGYVHNTNSAMQLRWPIDLRNDSPDNLNPPGATAAPIPGNQGGAAIHPMLSFWHKRDLNRYDNFVVEWRRYRDTAGAWNTIWTYNYQDTTFNGLPNASIQSNARTANQLGFEQVVIDLDPVMQMINTASPADVTDDDIVFRFRLDARNDFATADGLVIDNISVQNYSETAWRLWDAAVDPDGAGPLTTGSGVSYTETVDTPSDWWNRWYTGGDWSAIEWNTMLGGGLRSFHDSPQSQTAAPFYFNGSNYYDGVPINVDTFNVLEMRQILDLRGVDVTRRPSLQYWQRYYVGPSDTLLIQIATENTTSPTNTAPCGGTVGNFTDPPRQCYERTAGWDRWVTLETITGETRNYAWTRNTVDLSAYVGKRVRIRFVSDSLDNNTNRDGWYLDNIRFFYNNFTSPLPYQLTFFDPARNLDRWITEGGWGLDPERYRGSGGGPADLGTSPWEAYWFRCNSCSSSAANTLLNGIPDTPAGYAAARTAAGVGNYYPDTQPQFLMDVNFEFGSNGPRYANGTVWRSNDMVARFTRDVTAQGGEYTFITISDDAIRMRYVGGPPGNTGACSGWMIICNWSSHGRTVDLRTVTFPAAGNYRLIAEWYEGSGDAIVVISTGSNNFSFSDSPKTGVGPSFPNIPSATYSDSSLLLDGSIDMCGARAPVMEFYTVYDSPNTMTVDITTNGGLDWSRGNFNGPPGGHDGNRPAPVVTPTAVPISGFDASQWSGTSPTFPTVWQLRRYNLWAYINRYMGVRFRLTTGSSVRDGWWLTDITIGASSQTPRASLPAGTCP